MKCNRQLKKVQQTITETINNINNSNAFVTDQTDDSQIQKNTSLSSQHTAAITDNIACQKIRVGDIDISYKIFGKGDPILLIPGFSMTMEMWGPILNDLADNHTVIIFDNRGIGETTTGNRTFSMDQLIC